METDQDIPKYKIFRVDHEDYRDKLFFANDYDEKFKLIADETCDVREFLESDLNFAKFLYPDLVYDLGYCKSWKDLWKRSIESSFAKDLVSNRGVKKRQIKKGFKIASKEAFFESPTGWDRDYANNFAIWIKYDIKDFHIGRYETINSNAKQQLIDDGGFDWKDFAVFEAEDENMFYVNFEIKHEYSKEEVNEFFHVWMVSDDPGPVLFRDTRRAFFFAKDIKGISTGDVKVGNHVGFADNKIDMFGIDDIESHKNPDFSKPHRYAVFAVDDESTEGYQKEWRARKAEQLRIAKEKKLNFARMVIKDRSNNFSMETILEKTNPSDLVSSEDLELIAKAYDPVGTVYKDAYQDKINEIRGESHWTFGTSIQTIEDPETGLLRLATGTKGASFLIGVTQNTVRNRFNKGKIAGIKNDSIWIWLDTIKKAEELANEMQGVQN